MLYTSLGYTSVVYSCCKLAGEYTSHNSVYVVAMCVNSCILDGHVGFTIVVNS